MFHDFKFETSIWPTWHATRWNLQNVVEKHSRYNKLISLLKLQMKILNIQEK